MSDVLSRTFKPPQAEIQHKLTGNYLSEKGPLDSPFSDATDIKATAARRAARIGCRRCSRRGPRAASRETGQDMTNDAYEMGDRRRRASLTNGHPRQKFIFLLSSQEVRTPGVPRTPEGGRQAVYPHCGPSQDATAVGVGACTPTHPIPQEGVVGGGGTAPTTPSWGSGGWPALREVQVHA